MAVPKRKMSRSRTRSRRSQWKAQVNNLVTVRIRGREVTIPGRDTLLGPGSPTTVPATPTTAPAG